jgi:acetyl-CoA carboxylase carboxyltransferase component
VNQVLSDRLKVLLDPGSFVLSTDDANGELVGGTGRIHGRKVCIIAINPIASVQADPLSILKQEIDLLDYAGKNRLPVIHLADRPGRIAMDKTAIPVTIMRTFIDPHGAGGVFARFAKLSGVIPRIAVVFQPIATTLTYPVALCDIVIMVETAGMSLARPDMVRLMTGDNSPYEEYGGARMHANISGTCDILAESESEALLQVRKCIAMIPSDYHDLPPLSVPSAPAYDGSEKMAKIPDDPDTPYDMHHLIGRFIDEGSLLEHRSGYAGEVITGWARVEGMPFGLVANNSGIRGGILFSETCRKIAAFTSFCDSFNIPIVFLADLPGFMVGRTAEQEGIIHHGALVFSTLANLSVPHLCIVVRKAYTAGLYAMGGPGLGPVRFLALPDAQITIYGPKAIRMLAGEENLPLEKVQSMQALIGESSSLAHYLASGDIDRIISIGEVRDEVRQFLSDYRAQPLHREGPRRVICL